MIARAVVVLVLLIAPLARAGEAYNPLRAEAGGLPAPIDLTVRDAARQRDIPVRVYLPADASPAPVVLFSHGLGGSRAGGAYLAKHWAARGYVAVCLQHPGSDESVWREVPPRERLAAMRRAADAANFNLRVRDVPAVLDQLARWNEQPDHPLAGRLDLRRVGMSGHSFGALTTQAVAGQSFGRAGPMFTEPRITAAIALSPSSPRRGSPADAFGGVKIPWLLMTGTQDVAVIGDADLASRLAVFPALPPGSKYELVLEGAEHSAFSDRPLPGDRAQRNPNHHRAILAISTAFWDAYLRDDADARAWLDADADDAGPPSILDAGDTWKRR
jgi:predicted dienelactone hydrolase